MSSAHRFFFKTYSAPSSSYLSQHSFSLKFFSFFLSCFSNHLFACSHMENPSSNRAEISKKILAKKRARHSRHLEVEAEPEQHSSSSHASQHESESSDERPIKRLKKTKFSFQPSKAAGKSPKNRKEKKDKKTKKKKQVSPEQSSSLGNTFSSRNARIRFKKYTCYRPMLCESHVQLEDFPEIDAIVRARNWEKSVENPVFPYQALVQEFYANFKKNFDKSKTHRHEIFVRGIWVAFTEEVVRSVLGLPLVENPDDLVVSSDELDQMAMTLSGGIVKNWPSCGYMQPGVLTPLYKALFKIALTNWSPSLHNSSVRLEKAQLIYGIGSGKQIDLGSLIFSSIRTAALAKGSTLALPFPSLVHRIVSAYHPKKQPNDMTLKIKVITANSIRVSGSVPVTSPGVSTSTRPVAVKSNIVQTTILESLQDLEKNLTGRMNAMELKISQQLSDFQNVVLGRIEHIEEIVMQTRADGGKNVEKEAVPSEIPLTAAQIASDIERVIAAVVNEDQDEEDAETVKSMHQEIQEPDVPVDVQTSTASVPDTDELIELSQPQAPVKPPGRVTRKTKVAKLPTRRSTRR